MRWFHSQDFCIRNQIKSILLTEVSWIVLDFSRTGTQTNEQVLDVEEDPGSRTQGHGLTGEVST